MAPTPADVEDGAGGKDMVLEASPSASPSFMFEPFNPALLKAMLMEFLATALFLYFLSGMVVYGCTTRGDVTTCPLDFARILSIAFSGGLCIFVFVYFSASFSGGHLNPAVTLGLLIANKVTVMRFLLYVPMQMLGAIVGSAIVAGGNPGAFKVFGGAANGLAPNIHPFNAWGLEAMSTFALMFTVLAATDSKRHLAVNHLPALAPFAIGISVFLGHLVMIPVDGCSLNPARSFGSAVVAGKWDNHWVFWAGPCVGSAIAALIYEFVFRPDYEALASGGEEHEEIANLANAPDAPRSKREIAFSAFMDQFKAKGRLSRDHSKPILAPPTNV